MGAGRGVACWSMAVGGMGAARCVGTEGALGRFKGGYEQCSVGRAQHCEGALWGVGEGEWWR